MTAIKPTHRHKKTGTLLSIKRNYGVICTCYKEPVVYYMQMGKADYNDVVVTLVDNIEPLEVSKPVQSTLNFE